MAAEWLQRNDHPLLNHVILSTVFEHVRPTDLKEIRVVSKKWNMSTIPFTRNTWIVTIYGNVISYRGRWARLRHSRKIGKFIELFRLNQLGIPFGRFRLGDISMTDSVGQQFLRLCGKMAKEIDFSWHDYICMVEDVSELLRSTPNLVTFYIPNNLESRSHNVVRLFPDSPENLKTRLQSLIKLRYAVDAPRHRIQLCPTFMEELLEAAVNISHLSLGCSSMGANNESGTKCTSLEALTIIEKLGRQACIETLSFSDGEELVEILRRMKSKGMKLKRMNGSENFEQFIQVATIFKDTLEQLRISSIHSSVRAMNFPKLPHVTCLKIQVYSMLDLSLLNLSSNFPALEKLDVDEFGCDNEYAGFLSVVAPCPILKSFRLSSSTVRITEFNSTLSLFPNLTRLSLQVKIDGLVLRNIWSQMTQLEFLNLSVRMETTENLDSVFTGISTESLQGIEPLVNELGKMTSEVRMGIISKLRNERRQFPSIANLTNLRRLELIVFSNTPTYLTDLTGYLDFYAMQKLRHFEIRQCQLTKTCCEILTMDSDMALQSWTFEDENDLDIIPTMAY